MNAVNKVIFQGNLTVAPELKKTKGGKEVTTLSVAYNRGYKKGDEWEDEVSYFDVQVWGGLAKACVNNLVKGQSVRVEGRMKQERWENDGKNYSRIVTVADVVEFGPKPKGNGGFEDKVPF
jgi:single-strand DNA-binding protein